MMSYVDDSSTPPGTKQGDDTTRHEAERQEKCTSLVDLPILDPPIKSSYAPRHLSQITSNKCFFEASLESPDSLLHVATMIQLKVSLDALASGSVQT